MEPVTPNKRKGGTPVDGADDATSVIRPMGEDTGIVRGEYELVRGTRLGEYEIEEPLGGGGMGEVFSVIHSQIGKRAAIKVLKKDLSNPYNVERFKDEARVVNTIGHPNIVDIFAFGEMPDGRCYFVMELLVGETLRERIARGRIGVAEASAILKPLLRALEAAHGKGVIHRDLKPDNIFLVEIPGENPTVKLLDFGIAKLAKADHRIEQTKSGVMVGTPQYIAPEQAKGREIDHRADIYSLGGIVFEMLTGRPPFEADNAMEMVAKHLMEPAPNPSSVVPGLPPELDALVVAMLAKEPTERPALVDITKIIQDLKPEPIPVEDRKALELQPQPEPAVRTPAPHKPSVEEDAQPAFPSSTETASGEPISGAHTAVEVIAVPALTLPKMPVEPESAAFEVGRGRGVWVATSVIVLGIAMILSFVMIKVLRGDSAQPAVQIAANEDATVSSEPTAVPILDPDAAPAPVLVDASQPDATTIAPPTDAAVMQPDAGISRPLPPPPRPPPPRPQPPPPRPKLSLNLINTGKTIEVLVAGQRFTNQSRIDVDLVLNVVTTIVVRSEGRKLRRWTVKPTSSRPIKQSLAAQPDAPNKHEVGEFLVEVTACAKSQPEPVMEPQPQPEPPPQPERPPQQPQPPIGSPPSNLRKHLGLGGLALGAVGVGVGVVFGLRINGIERERNALCTESCPSDVKLQIETLQDRADTARTGMLVGLIGGGAVAALGTYLYITGRSHGRTTVGVVPASGGAVVTLSRTR